jgi:hypothetical protein
MNKAPKGEVFEGRSAEMKGETPWLASEDLMGLGDVKVKIIACHRYREVEFEAGRKEPTVYTLQFEGKQKQLVLNSTNRRKLVARFGPDVKSWKGQDIVLYVDTNVRMMGKIVSGIRIR